MNLQTLQNQLSKLSRRSNQLRKAIDTRAARQLAALPKKVGLASIDALVEALIPYASPRVRARLGRGAPTGKTPNNAGNGKSKGTRYSAAVKEQVIAAVRKGDRSAAEISNTFGPSIFSINAWKADLGLTKPRKKKPAQVASRSVTKPVRYARKKST
jgi:hypothetical protein